MLILFYNSLRFVTINTSVIKCAVYHLNYSIKSSIVTYNLKQNFKTPLVGHFSA